MKWSLKLGRVFGIDIFVHLTFVLLLGWVAISHYRRTSSFQGALAGVLFILLVFGIIVLHELGHALVAKRFGVQTRDITLYPIGGVARLEKMPDRPSEELLVAVAGPAVNVAIAAILLVVIEIAGLPLFPAGAEPALEGSLVTRLFWVNVVLALFNLLPAFPRDGGRMLRALLSLRGDPLRATRTAARIGQGLALFLGVLGLLHNPMLVLVALFVWMGAAGEAGAAHDKAALSGLQVHLAMIKDFRVLCTSDSLSSAARALIAGTQDDFPVLDADGGLVGLLTRTRLLEGLASLGADAPVEAVMERRFEVAGPFEMLHDAMIRIQESGGRSVPVIDHGRVVGIVTAENVSDLMLVRDAIEASSKSGAAALRRALPAPR